MYLFCPEGIERQEGDVLYGYRHDDDIIVLGRTLRKEAGAINKQLKDISLLDDMDVLKKDRCTVLYDAAVLLLDNLPDALKIAASMQANIQKTADTEHGLIASLDALQRPFKEAMSKLSPSFLPDQSNVLFDLGLGMALGASIVRLSIPLSEAIIGMHREGNLRQLPLFIEWLMGWPAGLKLNSSLSKFIGELYLWLLSLWNAGITEHLLINLPSILTFIGLAGCGLGLSVMIQVASIAARALTLHWEAFFMLAIRLFTAERTILRSLWRLMRGKKWNVLHERLDSADYSLDQLLLGTVMFATTLFLFPTILVYFLLFAVLAAARAVFQTAINSLALLLVLPVVWSSDGRGRGLLLEPKGDEVVLLRPGSQSVMQSLQVVGSTAHSIIARHFANPL